MAQRGRPIEWGKAFERYNSTARHYAKVAGTKLNSDWDFKDIDQFKEQVSSYRDTYGWGVAKTTSFLAQHAGLNGVSLKQLNAFRATAAELVEGPPSMKDAAAPFYTPASEFRTKAEKEAVRNAMKEAMTARVAENGWTKEALAEQVKKGEMTLAELNAYLSVDTTDSYERAEWISQNIFGSD